MQQVSSPRPDGLTHTQKKMLFIRKLQRRLSFWNIFFWTWYLVNVGCEHSHVGAMTTLSRLPSLLIYASSSQEIGERAPTAEEMVCSSNQCCHSNVTVWQMWRKLPWSFYNVLLLPQIALFSEDKPRVMA